MVSVTAVFSNPAVEVKVECQNRWYLLLTISILPLLITSTILATIATNIFDGLIHNSPTFNNANVSTSPTLTKHQHSKEKPSLTSQEMQQALEKVDLVPAVQEEQAVVPP